MYSRYSVPQNYSGNRFKKAPLETEMKTHKPTPSYSSTRTSLSPTFQDAINRQLSSNDNPKTDEDVYEFAENDEQIDYLQNVENKVPLTDEIIEDNEGDNIENDTLENENYLGNETEKSENSHEDRKKGIGTFLDEALPFLGKITSKINGEDLLLLSLILLLGSEESKESNSLVLPLLLLFLYN